MLRRLFIALSGLTLFIPAMVALAAAKPRVRLETSLGSIILELDPDKAPESVANFLRYTQDGYYDGTIFHRVIKDFMIQGGGFDREMNKKTPNAPIQNESNNGMANQRGTIAMARTSDPHSATAQFFINVVDNANLDYGAQGTNSWGYAVFGRVVAGMDVVDQIRLAETTRVGPYSDVPQTPIVIDSARLEPESE